MRGECGDRGGKRGRKRFPLSHRKRENRGEIARGIKAYCSLEGNCWKPIGGGEAEEGRERDRRAEETEAKGGRDRFGSCHNLPESREAGAGCDPAGRRWRRRPVCIAKPAAGTDEGGEKRGAGVKGREGRERGMKD